MGLNFRSCYPIASARHWKFNRSFNASQQKTHEASFHTNYYLAYVHKLILKKFSGTPLCYNLATCVPAARRLVWQHPSLAGPVRHRNQRPCLPSQLCYQTRSAPALFKPPVPKAAFWGFGWKTSGLQSLWCARSWLGAAPLLLLPPLPFQKLYLPHFLLVLDTDALLDFTIFLTVFMTDLCYGCLFSTLAIFFAVGEQGFISCCYWFQM